MIEGFVIEGVPFVFETKELAIRAMFPAKKEILKYEEAEDYGRDLFSRWTAVKETKVLPSDEPVNYRFQNGQAERIPD